MSTVLADSPPSYWPRTAALAAVGVIALLLGYYDTTASIVKIWSRSETFAHGFLIFPISAYMLWTRRRELAQFAPVPDWRGLIVLAMLGLGWLAADLARVQVVQQLALVAMIPAWLWAILGPRVTWAMAFPLAFLMLAVPMGESLIPPLMNFTADFAVNMLQLTGIPVYREGTFFTIPSGNWSVVEGCSGLRYLIASFTLGCLYAYLTYRTIWRRVLFGVAAVIVPIIANGLRAYMIVMIAHLSGMRLALGIDHYIYGWVFFGIVMLLLFWVGSLWREDEAIKADAGGAGSTPDLGPFSTPRPFPMIALAALVVAALWPVYAAYLDSKVPRDFHIRLAPPKPAGGWEPAVAFTDWQPHYLGADAYFTQTYRKGDKTVAVFLSYYRYQRQDAELVNSQNFMIRQKHPVWSNVGESERSEALDGTNVAMVQTKLRSPQLRLLIWNWDWLNGVATVNPYWAKLIEAKSRLLGHWDDAAAIIVYAPYDEQPETAAQTMREFLRDMMPSLTATLDRAADT
jgi:exosortase A